MNKSLDSILESVEMATSNKPYVYKDFAFHIKSR